MQIYFQRLTGKGHFDRSNKADSIAFLSLYMPIIRAEVGDFVELWNMHVIRKQPNRPQAVADRPEINYFYPP